MVKLASPSGMPSLIKPCKVQRSSGDDINSTTVVQHLCSNRPCIRSAEPFKAFCWLLKSLCTFSVMNKNGHFPPHPQKRGVSDYTILQLTGSACNFLKVQENKFGTFSGRSQPIPSPAVETLVLSPPFPPPPQPSPPHISPLTPHLWHHRWRDCHS